MNPILAELLIIIGVAAIAGLTMWGAVHTAHALIYGKELRVVKQQLEDTKNGSSFSELVERGPRDSGMFDRAE